MQLFNVAHFQVCKHIIYLFLGIAHFLSSLSGGSLAHQPLWYMIRACKTLNFSRAWEDSGLMGTPSVKAKAPSLSHTARLNQWNDLLLKQRANVTGGARIVLIFISRHPVVPLLIISPCCCSCWVQSSNPMKLVKGDGVIF